jgi:hypothetical protein
MNEDNGYVLGREFLVMVELEERWLPLDCQQDEADTGPRVDLLWISGLKTNRAYFSMRMLP